MCGIAGVARRGSEVVSVDTLARMAAAIRHRGPDGYGFAVNGRVGLAHVRLSIVDLVTGAQPLANEDGRYIITYNGEVYNWRDLRRELEARGHVFRTLCDTEVLVHGYEEWGVSLLNRLNGQFAFAIHDRADDSVFLARDRFGVRPLFYSLQHGNLYFGSEIKALLASGEIEAAADPRGLDEVFTFWAARPPRTPFRDVSALEPGTYGRWRDGGLWLGRYYELDYPEAGEEHVDALQQLDALLCSGVDFRMRADVPVGGYLSGGLDSSITCALAARSSPYTLRTFSVTFDDPRFDESTYQKEVAAAVGSQHAIQPIDASAIAAAFPDVIRHAESPLVRTAPVPMYLLARLVRDAGVKVVLTGEGSDELFLGYDLFKEVAVRRFCLRRPQSTARGRLFDRLYPYLMQGNRGGEFWRRFFLNAGSMSDPLFSHLPRFQLTARIKDFYTDGFREALDGANPLQELRSLLPVRFYGWSPLNRAAYLEMVTLLSPYLLSAQGDRMSMAHGVEGRYPFLDHRLFELASALPTGSRLRGLREKEILRRWASRVLPPRIGNRRKQPYRAPDAPSFFGAGAPAYVAEMLDPATISRIGVFSAPAVAGLVRRCRNGQAAGFRENQALVAILSTHLWYSEFLEQARTATPLDVRGADVLLHEAESASLMIA